MESTQVTVTLSIDKWHLIQAALLRHVGNFEVGAPQVHKIQVANQVITKELLKSVKF